jgi:histidyl-tRNA synthetase
VVLIGENEISSGSLTVKNMKTGEQTATTFEQLIKLAKEE